MNKIKLKIIAFGVFLGGAAMLAIGADGDAPQSKGRLEYKVVSGRVHEGDLEKALNEAAVEGWRVESVDALNDRYAVSVMVRSK